ncbi:MAG: hypothetical protein J5I94_06095, partial [Phaeodactylibacter sp.]|nr:hypothetical protein [Phaeodactylibacter sp.]
ENGTAGAPPEARAVEREKRKLRIVVAHFIETGFSVRSWGEFFLNGSLLFQPAVGGRNEKVKIRSLQK